MTETNWADFPEVVRTRFESLVATPNSLPFAIDNESTDEQFSPKGTHALIYIKTGESQQRSFGVRRRVRTVGVVMFLIRVPRGVADKSAKVLATSIRDAFNLVTTGGAVFKEASLKEMGRQGNWWQVNVSVPFRFDEML